tara:strand:- start:7923 stop:8039 length:117 start_codon:yes stop_codon:yes gene_type:complete
MIRAIKDFIKKRKDIKNPPNDVDIDIDDVVNEAMEGVQ